MMLGAWSVISFFTVRFFLKVLRTPQEKIHGSVNE